MDHLLSGFFMHELSRSNGRNRQSRLPALAEQTIFDHRDRESTRNQRPLLNQAAATNLRNATHHLHPAKDDVTGIESINAVLGSALTIIIVGAGYVYDWFDFTNDRIEHLLMGLCSGDTADDLRNLSFPTHGLGMGKVLGLPIWANPVWRPDAADLPKVVLLPQRGRA